MRRMLLVWSWLVFSFGAVACGPEFAVVPRGGLERVVAQGQGPAQGVTMIAFANQWDAYPYDLADYVTPIAVELYNPGPSEIRVSYVDLALRDGSGFRYAAINPYVPATIVGDADPILPPPPRPVLLASNGPIARWPPPGFTAVAAIRGGAHFGGGARRRPADPRRREASAASRRRGATGASSACPAAIATAAAGATAAAAGTATSCTAACAPTTGLASATGAARGSTRPTTTTGSSSGARPTTRRARRRRCSKPGCPRASCPPGARVSGFLYFKRATGARQSALDLSWDVRDARSGASLGSLHVPLEVVHR